MTAACFFRYAWITPERFEALLPPSTALRRMSGHLGRGPRLAAAVPERAHRSGAILRLQGFASAPLLRDLPARRLIRSAIRWSSEQSEPEAARLADWCLALHDRLDDCIDSDGDDDRDAAFLDRLAATDFPVLLLWSNPDLARFLFVCRDGGAAVAPMFRADRKARRKAATAALRYALGTFGRFGPRGGWIGSGFAVAQAGALPARIERGDERLCIEPDIGWAARNWFPEAAGGIVPGEDAWTYVGRKLEAGAAGAPRSTALRRVAAAAAALAERAWSFADVDAFLRDAADCLAVTVPPDRWRCDPHGWWLARVVHRELRVPGELLAACDRLYRAARTEIAAAGVRAGSPAPAAGPFPLRAARADPAAVLCTGEELTDWVLRAGAVRRAGGPFLPEHAPPDIGIVIHAEGGRARYKLHEPNPRRTADIVGRHLETLPDYLRCDGESTAIAPPPALSDQRLLRRASPEMAVERVEAAGDAMFRFPITGPDTAAQIAREMASPRYAAAPDLVPILFDEGAAQRLSFGRLDPVNRVWFLPPAEARAMAAELKGPGRLAALYAVELDTALGSPPWVGVLVEGRMSRLPTASSVAFRWLLHACRTAAAPIVVRAERYHDLPPLLADGQGSPLACEIYAALPIAAASHAAETAAEARLHPCAVG